MILEKQRATEAIDYTFSAVHGIGPEYQGDIFSQSPFIAPPYFQDSYKRGEALPVYLNEQSLKYIRDRSRKLHAENEFAICAGLNRVSYLIGSGLKYHAEPRNEDVKEETVAAVQKIIEACHLMNNLSEVEAESAWRYDRDGEFFLHLTERDSGLLSVRFIEPEHVRAPSGGNDPSDSFGIHCDPEDIVNRLGYYVVKNPLRSNFPEEVDADEVIHVRANVDSGSKRGVPTSYPVEGNFRRAEELMAAMTSTAKLRAKIALIRHIDGSNKSAAEVLKAEIEADGGAQVHDPYTGAPRNVESYRLGTILTASKNIKYEMPSAGSNSSDGVNILNAELASIAARYVMPVSMLTATPGSVSGPALLAAEGPEARNFKRLQCVFRNAFAESRKPGYESLLWRQIRIAVDRGVLPASVFSDVVIRAECPEVVSRDMDRRSSADKVYYDMGVISRKTLAGQLGLDWDQEQRQRATEGSAAPGMLQGPPDVLANPLDTQPDPPRLGLPTDPVAGGEPGTEGLVRHGLVKAGISKNGTPYAYRHGEGKGRRKLPKGAAAILMKWGCKPGGGSLELKPEQQEALGLHQSTTDDKVLSRVRQLPLPELYRLHDATAARIKELQ